MMPYTAAAVALARRDARQLLAWPVEVQQPAREIMDRFATTTPPARGKRKRSRT
jgi:hypothetical protein